MPRIPFEKLEGKTNLDGDDFFNDKKVRNFASENEQLAEVVSHSTSIENPLWYQVYYRSFTLVEEA